MCVWYVCVWHVCMYVCVTCTCVWHVCVCDMSVCVEDVLNRHLFLLTSGGGVGVYLFPNIFSHPQPAPAAAKNSWKKKKNHFFYEYGQKRSPRESKRQKVVKKRLTSAPIITVSAHTPLAAIATPDINPPPKMEISDRNPTNQNIVTPSTNVILSKWSSVDITPRGVKKKMLRKNLQQVQWESPMARGAEWPFQS